MKALNPVIPRGVPIAGAYGSMANGWGTLAEQPESFGPTPANTPDEVQEEVQEVTGDGRPEQASDEVPVSG